MTSAKFSYVLNVKIGRLFWLQLICYVFRFTIDLQEYSVINVNGVLGIFRLTINRYFINVHRKHKALLQLEYMVMVWFLSNRLLYAFFLDSFFKKVKTIYMLNKLLYLISLILRKFRWYILRIEIYAFESPRSIRNTQFVNNLHYKPCCCHEKSTFITNDKLRN